MSMDNDAAYSAAVHEFYTTYRPLQRRYNLRMRSHQSIYDDGFIEIWEYNGESRGRCVCKAKEADDVALYKSATDWLKDYAHRKEKRESEVAEYEKTAV